MDSSILYTPFLCSDILLCTVLGEVWAWGSGLGQMGLGQNSGFEQTWLQ